MSDLDDMLGSLPSLQYSFSDEDQLPSVTGLTYLRSTQNVSSQRTSEIVVPATPTPPNEQHELACTVLDITSRDEEKGELKRSIPLDSNDQIAVDDAVMTRGGIKKSSHKMLESTNSADQNMTTNFYGEEYLLEHSTSTENRIMYGIPSLSPTAQKYRRVHIAKGTKASNLCATRVFTKFCAQLILKNSDKMNQCYQDAKVFESLTRKTGAECLNFLCLLIGHENNCTRNMSEAQKTRLVYFLSEFVCSYESPKKGNEVKSNTMRSYLCGIQRVLRNEIGYKDLELFAIPELMIVVDNRFKELQRQGLMVESHNTLSLNDVQVLFTNFNKVSNTGLGYRDRLVFSVGLATGLRTTALHTLRTNQLRKENVRGIQCLMFYSVVGGISGESKTHGGGWNAVNDKPQIFPIPNEELMGGLFNLYEIVNEYLEFRKASNARSDRFFLGLKRGGNVYGTNPNDFFLYKT